MIHSLTEWYEENCDSDYEPSEEDEPLEEYLEMKCETETLPRTKVDKKGFHELVFSDDECQRYFNFVKAIIQYVKQMCK